MIRSASCATPLLGTMGGVHPYFDLERAAAAREHVAELDDLHAGDLGQHRAHATGRYGLLVTRSGNRFRRPGQAVVHANTPPILKAQSA